MSLDIPAANLLDEVVKRGLVPVSIFALCSVLSTTTLLSWITYRLVWRHDYRSQYIILIYNLLLGDLQQSLSFLISIHWLTLGRIDSPSVTCFAQGWLIQIGDMSSGFFVLAIALHTWYSVVMGRKISHAAFTSGILGIWTFAILLTFLGPAIHGPHYFVRAGAWCWAGPKYDIERLWLHYVWVFTIEIGTLAIYSHIFIHLRKRLRTIRSVTPKAQLGSEGSKTRLSQAARYMVLYPLIYVLLTLPLAAGRMASMSGVTPPDIYYCIAGSMMTSCGWLDSLLYTLTRRVFIKTEPSPRDRRSMRVIPSEAARNKRRWIGAGASDLDSTAPMGALPRWPHSSFATIDTKDPRDSGDDFDEIPAYQLRSGRSTPLGMLESGRHPQLQTLSQTETVILRGEEQQRVVEDRIFSETRIEVVSISRDELLALDQKKP